MSFVAECLHRARTATFSLLRLRTLGAFVIPVDENGEVVLIRLAYGGNDWQLPGGGVRRGETFQQAALREAREEIGLELTAGGHIYLQGVFFKRRGNWVDHIAVFVVEGWKLTESKSWEIVEVARFHPKNLSSDVRPSTRRRINEWIGSAPASEHW